MKKERNGRLCRTILGILLAAAMLGSTGCTPAAPIDTDDVLKHEEKEEKTKSKPEEEEEVVNMRNAVEKTAVEFVDGAVDETVDGTVDGRSFEFRLKEKMPKDENYMISPYSIKTVLALAANGADEAVQAEITAALGIDDLQAFGVSVQRLLSECAASNDPDVRAALSFANAIWLNRDNLGEAAPQIAFSEAFETTAAEYYGAESAVVGADDAVDTINRWTSEHTGGKVERIVDDAEFLAALTNAVYMKASWIFPFSPEATREETFYDRDGNGTKTEFMHNVEFFDYYEDDKMRMVCLPYYGDLYLYIVLGDDSGFEAARGSMTRQEVRLSIPKWKTESSFELEGILRALGITEAFSGGFAPMVTGLPEDVTDLCISKVMHKTEIDVDENGTEAAAASAVLVVPQAALPEVQEPVVFCADHPFSYFICRKSSGGAEGGAESGSEGEILFFGQFVYAD